MVARIVVVLVVGALVVASGAQAATRTPTEVVRAWSRALNAGDNRAAGRLFAPDAIVIQGNIVFRLPDARTAALWNSGLPCSGRIVKLTRRGNVVTATFRLGNRPSSRCDAPGDLAAAQFTVVKGRITRWVQVPVESGPTA